MASITALEKDGKLVGKNVPPLALPGSQKVKEQKKVKKPPVPPHEQDEMDVATGEDDSVVEGNLEEEEDIEEEESEDVREKGGKDDDDDEEEREAAGDGVPAADLLEKQERTVSVGAASNDLPPRSCHYHQHHLL